PLRPALAAAADEIGDLEKRLAEVARQIVAVARQTPSIARLRTVPGIGLLIATSLVAFLGDPHRFPSGRHFASYLGLTPARILQRHAPSSRCDQQTRRLLSAHASRAWSALVPVARQEDQTTRASPTLGASHRGAARPQQSRRRRRQ